MPNMDPKKCPMPSQDPNVRNKNFKEVALGYTAEMAVNEAKRCLQCKKPACRTGCPVQTMQPLKAELPSAVTAAGPTTTLTMLRLRPRACSAPRARNTL